MGNTSTLQFNSPLQTVHPHGRGEHAKPGTLARYSGRFIPTGVGNTRTCLSASRAIPVHPHGRGEHRFRVVYDLLNGGSSPRAWGTREYSDQTISIDRFIPTGVGNTGHDLHLRPGAPVHPHGRGEHPGLIRLYERFGGSSPRAWGTRVIEFADIPTNRFIPTGVGNTISWRLIFRGIPVHPHGRGEHVRH